MAEYWLDEYGITDAWETTRGEGTTIAVIDTGIGTGAEEIDDAVSAGTDVSGSGSDDGRTPVGVLNRNHGTLVGSIAAARGNGEDEGLIGASRRKRTSCPFRSASRHPSPFPSSSRCRRPSGGPSTTAQT